MLVGVIGVSLPVYWLGEVVNLFTQNRLHDSVFSWVPPLGYVSLTDDPGQWALHLLFPWPCVTGATVGIRVPATAGQPERHNDRPGMVNSQSPLNTPATTAVLSGKGPQALGQ